MTTPDKETMLNWYRQMVLIRRFEEKCAELYTTGDIGGFLHLYIGQEAIAVAAQSIFRADDNIITAYRDHGVALARGIPTKTVMAEMLGKATGVSKGKGGSMHLADIDRRFWGGWAIVGGHLPLAAGIALADQYSGADRITVAFMGDGSTNIGYFHEALNLAAVWKLPVIWVVENNQYGMGTAVTRASAVSDIVKKAEAYGMPCCQQVLDGADIFEIREQFEMAEAYVRDGEGSYMMEILTYRFRGHSMGDPERYRQQEEVEKKKTEADPIIRLGNYLLEKKLVTQEELDAQAQSAEEEVAEAIEFAKKSPFPAPEELYANVYV
ncbi:MAG: pyruvate dehydrogenase (acetyl-transferring) E1 component subunit alpha [Anaerolineae bacterium]|nr:pyruvate dehydrogenase (acetyl-transferring) E1 component subunit alpha [Anaerolineae bacterium]